jgi:inner membrane protein involved in colicin E2 resistance
MSQKKKVLLNFLWFLVGMAAIAAIPLLLIEKCSEARKPKIRENQSQKQGSVDHSGDKQTICGNLIITCRTV